MLQDRNVREPVGKYYLKEQVVAGPCTETLLAAGTCLAQPKLRRLIRWTMPSRILQGFMSYFSGYAQGMGDKCRVYICSLEKMREKMTLFELINGRAAKRRKIVPEPFRQFF